MLAVSPELQVLVGDVYRVIVSLHHQVASPGGGAQHHHGLPGLQDDLSVCKEWVVLEENMARTERVQPGNDVLMILD